MTQFGEGPNSPPAPVVTVGTSVQGDVLAGRYRLEEHINNDARGRQVWRGIDLVLRRPVAVVLRHPGGEHAAEMLAAAVATSRITHPHLIDVYDVFDEGTHAYVVREWVDGASLRELVTDGPLDTARATAIAHAVASAVAAAHATRMVHGNVHPGTVLIADDGRVVLSDARTDESTTPEQDVRAVGAVLYCALTGHWPHDEAGPDRLPDGARDPAGKLASPRQMRGGLPSYLSELATDLLDPMVQGPTAESLAVELGRLDTERNDELFGDGGALGFTTPHQRTENETPSHTGRKIAIGIAALVLISAAAFVIAGKLHGGGGGGKPVSVTSPSGKPTASHPTGQPTPVALTPSQVRIVDPPKGDRTEVDGSNLLVDGDPSTNWHTDRYTSAKFGGLKPGMGILIDLGTAIHVLNVQVEFLAPGATVAVEVGDTDPGATSAGDAQIAKSFKTIGQPREAGATTVLDVDQSTRFVLLWITSLPPAGSKYPDKFGVTVDEIKVFKA